MIDTITATDLRDKVADVLDQVRFTHRPVEVTRFGRTVALIVGVPEDYADDQNTDYRFALDSMSDALNRRSS